MKPTELDYYYRFDFSEILGEVEVGSRVYVLDELDQEWPATIKAVTPDFVIAEIG